MAASAPTRPVWPLLGLLGLAAATRVPWLGRSLGESDCARYLLGVAQWLRHGPAAPFIYAKQLSPGYYALAVALARRSGASPRALLQAVSLAAALVSAALVYLLGRCLGGARTAVWAAVLFLLAPGVWWLGIEPHPQGVAAMLLVLALLAFQRRRGLAAALAATAALAASLLCKADMIVFAAIFPAWGWTAAPAPARWRRALAAGAVPAAALGIFLLLRTVLLGTGWRQAQQLTTASVRQFLELPQGAAWIKQLLPAVTALGVATTLLVAAGLALGLWQPAWRRRWLLPLAAWVLPGGLFWLLMRGNNVRHMALLGLLPLFAALEAVGADLQRQRRPRLPARAAALPLLCLAVVGANWLLPPASSNVTLYPSGNVPASAADLAARSRDLRAALAAALRSTPPGQPLPCWLGNATLPYLELDLLQSHPEARLLSLAGIGGSEAVQFLLPSGGVVRLVEVNSPAAMRAAQRRCRQAFGAASASLEYTPAAVHAQFFGSEWRSLPWLRHWYPAAAAPRPGATAALRH